MIPISFNPLGGSWTLVAVLLAVITGAVLAFPPRFRGTSVFRKRAETAVRLLAIPIFAILFTRPSWVAVVVEELPATVEILCDLSESMSVEDGDSSGKSRYDAMRDAFADAQDSLKALSERCDVHVVGFGETIEELPVADGVVTFPAAPTGRETRLGDALAEALKTTAGKRLLSVALLSDGAQRTWDEDAESPQEVALRYRDAERPITVALFGSKDGSASVRDVAIDDLRANDRVFLGNELVVSGRLRALGFANKELPVQLDGAGKNDGRRNRDRRPEIGRRDDSLAVYLQAGDGRGMEITRFDPDSTARTSRDEQRAQRVRQGDRRGR